MKGTIFAIQHYAVHDGPGIRTLVFLKGCSLRCVWCCNPESQSDHFQLRYISFHCKSCLRCITACSRGAITTAGETLLHDFDICRNCSDKPCIDACPYEALSVTGREVTPDELMDVLIRDIPFYRNSGGGVTFTGGEPFHQPGFLVEMLRRCRGSGIHTAIETCGWTTETILLEAIPLTGLFLFDLKIINPDLHLRYTGQPVGPILDNLAFVAARHPEVIIRFPLIPGITDTDENLQEIVQVMHKNLLKRIHLEPYHTLGIDKYQEHGMKYGLLDLTPYAPGKLEEVRRFFTEHSIEGTIA